MSKRPGRCLDVEVLEDRQLWSAASVLPVPRLLVALQPAPPAVSEVSISWAPGNGLGLVQYVDHRAPALLAGSEANLRLDLVSGLKWGDASGPEHFVLIQAALRSGWVRGLLVPDTSGPEHLELMQASLASVTSSVPG